MEEDVSHPATDVRINLFYHQMEYDQARSYQNGYD